MNRKIIPAAAIALLPLAAACSSNDNGTATPAATATVTVTAPAPAPASTPTPTPKATTTPTPTTPAAKPSKKPPAPSVQTGLKIGQSAVMRRTDGSNTAVLRVTVDTVETSTKSRSQYGGKKAKGVFRFITVSYQNLLPKSASATNDANLMPYNPLDFYIRDSQGTHYDPLEGNSFEAMDQIMDSGQLNPGEKAHGTFAIDAPPTATELIYAPYDRTYASWVLPKG
jgi:hypothetical protein